MGFEEMVVALVGTVLGIGLLGFIIARVTGLIKSWIERDKTGYEQDAFNRLAKAFMEHKKTTERRLKNLEAIIADDSSDVSGDRQISEPHKTIEIDEEEAEDEHSRQREERSGGGNLHNMLKN